jgi:hypothetical protein
MAYATPATTGPALSPRICADAARLVRRLIGVTDFASQDVDGAISMAMSDKALHQCRSSAGSSPAL